MCAVSCCAVLEKVGYDAFVEVNVSPSTAPDSYLLLALNNLYYAFDRDDSGAVDVVEFASAFTLFASGSKSEKLVEAFALFDSNGSGRLSKLALWKFFRAVLTMFGGIVSISHELTGDDLAQSAVDKGAIEITTVQHVLACVALLVLPLVTFV